MFVKPISEKHMNRIHQIRQIVKNFKTQNPSHCQTINKEEYQEMIKIKKAQRLNTQKQQVKQLKNSLINQQPKSYKKSDIFKQINSSNFRGSSLKGKSPLFKIILKTELPKQQKDNQPNFIKSLKTNYSTFSPSSKQKNATLIKQESSNFKNLKNLSSITNAIKNKSQVKFDKEQLVLQSQAKLANKSSRVIKTKSNRGNMQSLANQIQDLIQKNVRVINDSLEKIRGQPVYDKINSVHDIENCFYSQYATNHKPYDRRINTKKKVQKDQLCFTGIQRKKFNKVYHKAAYKLQTNSFVHESQYDDHGNQTIDQQRIKHNLQQQYDVIDRFQQKPYKRSTFEQPQSISQKRINESNNHRRYLTEENFNVNKQRNSVLQTHIKTKYWQDYSGKIFRLN